MNAISSPSPRSYTVVDHTYEVVVVGDFLECFELVLVYLQCLLVESEHLLPGDALARIYLRRTFANYSVDNSRSNDELARENFGRPVADR